MIGGFAKVLVDLMTSAGGIEYSEAAKDLVLHDVDDVPIPVASPRLLWRMKAVTHREKMPPICSSSGTGPRSGAKNRRGYRQWQTGASARLFALLLEGFYGAL